MGRSQAASACPDDVQLELLARGEAADQTAELHVRQCGRCLAAVREIQENNQFLTRATQVLRSGERARWGEITAADSIPGYRLMAEIHRGGQGVVYKAYHEPTRRFVAIKLLLQGAFATPRQRHRFEREIEIAAGLRHPNIVPVYDTGALPGGRVGFVMEYVDGVPLDRWAARTDGAAPAAKGSDAARALKLLLKVCDAIRYAHERGIIHRDLKPGNILVDSRDEPHILDFGLARMVDGALEDRERRLTLTQVGEIVGTYAYAAPEQMKGDPHLIDIRTDVYALGAIAYELLTGQLPCSVGGSMSDVVCSITQAEPRPPSALHAGIDDELDTIILKALAKEPPRRYPSAGALLEDLTRYQRGEAIDAKRDSNWYVLRKFASRRKRLLVGVSVACLAILIGAAAAAYGLLQAARARQLAMVEEARAESQALGWRTAAGLIQQTLVPFEESPNDEVLGREVRAGLDRLQSKLEFGALASEPDAEAAARTLFAEVLLRPQGSSVAEESLRYTIATLYNEHGENYPVLAGAIHALADVLYQRGRMVEAERKVRQAIDLRRRPLPKDDLALAASLHLLSRILIAKGETAAAAAPCDEALEILRSVPVVDASEQVGALLTRATINSDLGRSEDAEAIAREALVMCLASIDDSDPLLAECLRRIVELYRVDDKRPPDAGLAAALNAQSRAEIAETLAAAIGDMEVRGTTVADRRRHAGGLETILAMKKSLLGEWHISGTRTLALIVSDYRRIEDWINFESAVRRVIQILEAALGSNHLALVQPHEWLANCLLVREDHVGAIAACRRMVEIWEAQPEFARDGLWIANQHRWLADILALGGEFAEAEREFTACIELLKHDGLADHYLVDICNGGLGWVSLHLGRPEQAELLTRSALTRYSPRTDAPPDQLAWLHRHLGHVLLARGKLDEAAAEIDAALQYVRSRPDTRYAFHTFEDEIELANLTGNHHEAARLASELDVMRRQLLGPREP